MQKVRIFAVIVCFLFTSGVFATRVGSPLLNAEDLAFERADHESGPAIHATLDAPEYWESYGQWMCFNPEQVEFLTVELVYGHLKQHPAIIVSTPGQSFEIGPDGDMEVDAPLALAHWRELLDGSKGICIYAAFLQYTESESEPKFPMPIS